MAVFNAPSTTFRRDFLTGIVAALIALVLLLATHLYRPTATTLFAEELVNFAHYPLFLVVTSLLFVAARSFLTPIRSRATWIALSLAMLLGIVSEAIQIAGPRDAAWDDLITDWLGSATVAGYLIATDKSAAGILSGRLAWAAAGMAVMLAVSPLVLIGLAYLERNAAMPDLLNADADLGGTFRTAQFSSIDVMSDGVGDTRYVRVGLRHGSSPGIILHDIYPDWSGHRALRLTLANPGPLPLRLNIRIQDRAHMAGDQAFADRFNRVMELPQGRTTIELALVDIREAPAVRMLELADIHSIVIFATARDAGRQFDIFELELSD